MENQIKTLNTEESKVERDELRNNVEFVSQLETLLKSLKESDPLTTFCRGGKDKSKNKQGEVIPIVHDRDKISLDFCME